jgi:hypothetical protein
MVLRGIARDIIETLERRKRYCCTFSLFPAFPEQISR